MIRAVLIDFDGVIRRWDPWSPDPSLGVTEEDIRKAAFEADRLGRVVTGEWTDDEWRDEIAHVLERDHGPNGRAAAEAWRALVGRVDEEMLELVRRLREVVPVALVSNATTRLESDLAALGLSDAFDLVVNSSRVGHAKPDERIFVWGAGQLGVALDECLFIDDTLENVEEAAKLGLRTIHFTDARALRTALGEFGILSADAARRRLEFLVREARRNEARVLAELQSRTAIHAYAEIFPPEAPPPTIDELKRYWSESLRERIGFVAVVDTEIVGISLAGPDPLEPAVGHLSRLYVSPELSGRGIGGRLYQTCMRHLGELGFTEATLWVLEGNVRARNWYERLGWRATGERKPVYAPTGIDDLRYRLTSI